MIFGTHDDKTLAQLADVSTRASKTALMADGHLGYVMPIGGVAAYQNQVSVVGVGFDIACGNCAIRTDLRADQYSRVEWEAIADAIKSRISFGVGRKNVADDAPTDAKLFASDAWSLLPTNAREPLRDKARTQLGTVGSGNHYVDVFADEFGDVWVGVHFGSRGFGHTTASGFLALAQGEQWGARVPERETLLDLDTPMGHDYWHLMELAGAYAYAGREWVARKVVALLGATEVEMIHNHHNFAWKETHGGEDYVVVRKGATPAFPGQRGFVGGSMGDESVILEGVESPLSAPALYSTVHGAGRVMSRSEAAGRVKRSRAWVCGNRECGAWKPAREERRGADGALPRCDACGGKLHLRDREEVKRAGKITTEMLNDWIGPRGLILRGGGLDEAPQAYRRLPDVLAAQGDTIRVLHTLTPLVVVMAGADEFDPYKD